MPHDLNETELEFIKGLMEQIKSELGTIDVTFDDHPEPIGVGTFEYDPASFDIYILNRKAATLTFEVETIYIHDMETAYTGLHLYRDIDFCADTGWSKRIRQANPGIENRIYEGVYIDISNPNFLDVIRNLIKDLIPPPPKGEEYEDR